MTPIHFEQARAALVALKELFAAHPRGRLDRAAFDNVQSLCLEAERAVSDIDCRRALRNIHVYSVLLSSAESEAPRVADFVRLRVHQALASLGSKLKALEAGETMVV